MLKKLVVALLLIIFLAGGRFFLEWKNSLVFNWQDRLGWPVWLLRSFLKRGNLAREISQLSLENQALRSEIVSVSGQGTNDDHYRRAKIYSSYPLNSRSTILIDAGRNQGIKELTPVTIFGRLLLGQVAQVFENYSQVRTIFDVSWQMPVRIGEGEVDALLVGGPELKVTLVVADKAIKEGQTVVSASETFPYGLKIGEVKNVRLDADGVFKEADLSLPYNINELREVWLILDS